MKKLLLGLFLLIIVVVFSIIVIYYYNYEPDKIYEPQFKSKAPNQNVEYIFAIHPLHNPERLFKIYSPLIDYLNKNITNIKFRLEASRNYEEFDKKLYSRLPDFALPNPYQTVHSIKHGYHVIAKMGDDHKFTGIILVRRDGSIKQINDLRGKKVAYPSSNALAACIMPQYYLYTHGINVNHDIENIYVGSQESAIMNVYLGYVAAGVTWPVPWEAFQKEHPNESNELEVKWETSSLINNGVVARDDIPAEITKQVAELLNTLHTTKEGRIILSNIPLSRFELADDKRYIVIEDFLSIFSKKVRVLDGVNK